MPSIAAGGSTRGATAASPTAVGEGSGPPLAATAVSSTGSAPSEVADDEDFEDLDGGGGLAHGPAASGTTEPSGAASTGVAGTIKAAPLLAAAMSAALATVGSVPTSVELTTAGALFNSMGTHRGSSALRGPSVHTRTSVKTLNLGANAQ